MTEQDRARKAAKQVITKNPLRIIAMLLECEYSELRAKSRSGGYTVFKDNVAVGRYNKAKELFTFNDKHHCMINHVIAPHSGMLVIPYFDNYLVHKVRYSLVSKWVSQKALNKYAGSGWMFPRGVMITYRFGVTTLEFEINRYIDSNKGYFYG